MNRQILVVDDEEPNRELIATYLQEQGLKVLEALELGANDHVTKPFSMPVLLARIRAVLRTRQAAEDGAAGGFPGPGAILGGRLKLEKVVGRGGFAVVFRAMHLELERRVAVKVLKSALEEKNIAEARFRREGRSMTRLRHENCVAVLRAMLTNEPARRPTAQALVHDLEQLQQKDMLPGAAESERASDDQARNTENTTLLIHAENDQESGGQAPSAKEP